MRTISIGQMPMTVVGVYFLFCRGQLRYIGQSVNVAARVGQHMRGANPALRACDELRVFECDESELDNWEGLFIRLLSPPENGRVAGAMHAPQSTISDKQLISMAIPKEGLIEGAPAPARPITIEGREQNALLSRDQVAVRYGISRRWLELAAYKGEGPPMVKLSRRMVRYRPQDIEDWLRRKEVVTA